MEYDLNVIPDWAPERKKRISEALSDTADNDKWLAEVKAKTLEEAEEAAPDDYCEQYCRMRAEEIRNQAKKG